VAGPNHGARSLGDIYAYGGTELSLTIPTLEKETTLENLQAAGLWQQANRYASTSDAGSNISMDISTSIIRRRTTMS